MTEIVPRASSDPFAQCPAGCVCGVRELIAREYEHGSRDADEIDAAEMRAMLIAVREGYETVRSDPRLVERRHAANRAWSRVERQLGVLRTMIEEKRIGRAAADVRQARSVKTESRHATWLRWVRWPVVAGIGLFDVWYFSQVFRYLTSQTGDATNGGQSAATATMETIVAVVPGLVLAIIIAASAEALLRPLRAWRSAISRTTEGRSVLRWLGRLAWFSLPVLFVAFLIFVVAVWAGLRAKYPTPPSAGYPLLPVMLLIVLLAIGTMAVKILADDWAADRLAAAQRRIWFLRSIYRRRARKADKLIGDYDSAWSDLRTLRDDLVGLLRIKMLSAWEGFILRIRSLHRQAGNVTAAQWTDNPDNAVVRPEFDGIPQPAMELGPLHEICRQIDGRNPDDLRQEKQRLDEAYAAQVSERLDDSPDGTSSVGIR